MTTRALAAIALAGVVLQAPLLWAQGDEVPPSPQPNEPRDDSRSSPGHAQRVFGWTAVSIGGATVVAGLVVAGVAAAKLAELDCCDHRCGPDQHEDAESYNDLRLPAGLTIFAGAALVGLGLPFLLVGEAAADAPLAAVVSPGGITLRGRF